MKRLILVFTSILIVTAIHAQRGKVMAAEAFLDNKDLASAKERIDDALVHPKTLDWPKTYIVAARLSAAQFAKDKKKTDLLLEATNHFFKAAELDAKGNEKGKGKGRYQKDIKVALAFFMPELQNEGIDAFNKENYELAMKLFDSVINLNKLSVYEEDNLPADSVFIYYTGLAASRSSNWEKAETYFLEAIDLGYAEGDPILLLNEVYTETKDSVKAEANLKRGFELYPEDDRIFTNLINYYLQTSQNEAALEYLNAAIKKDPENHSFYYARGVLYDMGKDFEKALADYNTALELKNDYFEPLLNIGVIYYNKGAEDMNSANDIKDNKAYEAAKKAASEVFRKSLPYMEKAHELKPDDLMVLETLKNLYYRFEMMDKYNEVNEKMKIK